MNEKYKELKASMLADIAERARRVLDTIEGKEPDMVDDEKLVTVCHGLMNAANALEITAAIGMVVPWLLESGEREDEMRECNNIEERRKIANRLRGLDSKISDRDTLSTAVDELRMAVCGSAAISPVEYSVRNLVGFALELADLIEDNQYSGTCRNVYPNNEDHHCDNGFRCSACGDTVEDCENYRVSGTWNYCPKCRAKVVG